MNAILQVDSIEPETFDPAVWLPHVKSKCTDLAIYVHATNGNPADAPVIGPDPHMLYAANELPVRVLAAPRTHRFGSKPTESKYLKVKSIADFKQLGRSGDFRRHLADGRLQFRDTHLDALHLAKARGNSFPVQRDFPSLTFPVHGPTTYHEKILTSQYEAIAETLDIPISDTVNYFTTENNNHHSEPACENTPFDFMDLNETLQQMATLLDLDPALVSPDNPKVQSYMAQFSAEEKAAFKHHCHGIDCSDVTEVKFEILIASKHGDPTKGAFDLQPDEIPVTKDYVKIDSTKMRDLRNVPANERSRCVAATAVQQKSSS